jgi:23S rRNA (guanosine2251-2'-O)-methyltransferase
VNYFCHVPTVLWAHGGHGLRGDDECQNFIFFMRKLEMHELNRKSPEAFKDAEKVPIVVVLDNIRSMHNVGSVFRTADAFLLQGIFLCGYTPQPPHRDITKTALGATETVAWKYFQTTKEAVLSLQDEGYEIWSVEQVENSIALNKFDSTGKKLAIVFGNEVSGVENEILQLSNGCIEIPQMGMKHSLNISVAAGIVLWELVRGRV